MLKRSPSESNASKYHDAQSYLEYVLVIGVISIVLISFTPFIQRMLQGMLKVTADQVGIQVNGDQPFDEYGHMEYVNVQTISRIDKRELNYGVYLYNDDILTMSNRSVNLGFQPEPIR